MPIACRGNLACGSAPRQVVQQLGLDGSATEPGVLAQVPKICRHPFLGIPLAGGLATASGCISDLSGTVLQLGSRLLSNFSLCRFSNLACGSATWQVAQQLEPVRVQQRGLRLGNLAGGSAPWRAA